MNIKFIKIAFGILAMLFTSLSNAGLLAPGDIISDSDGVNWQYVGEFDMASGPLYYDANGDGIEDDPAPIYSGITAAEANFGVLAPTELYAISTEEIIVNHLAWYDGFSSFYETRAEDYFADAANDGIYSQLGDHSAWVQDRAEFGDNKINYVFKSVDVPEPSTIAIFSLALLAFVRRAFIK